MIEKFEMVAKTMQGLEEILAEELRAIGATNVEPGLRMVSFKGDLETLYKANLCCRTALRILKPIYRFYASSPDELYEKSKEFEWSTVLSLDKTFAVNTVAHSEEFTHSRYATYRVKDAINDWFSDRFGDKRPRVSTTDPDILINLHISGDRVTLSLDSSGESLHKRGYRTAQTDAPINEVLAAGIILKSGWRGDCPFVDPMCGSGTFLIEAALIAANINPGIFRTHFAFERWKDFNAELFDRIYNDDSNERDVTVPIIGADISPKAIAITQKNLRSARVQKVVETFVRPLNEWQEAPEAGVLVTNPPYGERLNFDHLDELYATLGTKLKRVFKGYHAWIIGYKDEHFNRIGLAPSQKIPMMNGALECKLEEFIIFEGTKREFRKSGGDIKDHVTESRHSSPRGQWRGPSKPSHGRHFNDITPGERFRRAFDEKESTMGRRKQHPPKSFYPFKKNNVPEERPERPDDLQPTLPPQDGPLMRDRRSGWKKRPDWMGKKADEQTDNQK